MAGPSHARQPLGDNRLAQARSAQFALLLIIAVTFRFPAYGEWNYAVDDQFFALVGRRLLAGDLLYVDIWDRKPPLLYLTYAAIAWVHSSVLAYQLVATVFAALGAYGTMRIARLFTPFPAAMMAGVAYAALLTRFGGENGEAAVFYNPLMIFSAWSIASSLDALQRGILPHRVLLGTFTAGLSIAYKQSAFFEAAFFGLAVLAFLARSRMEPRSLIGRALVLATIGALPMLAIGLFYWQIGHFAELWHALVQSNLDRIYDHVGRTTRVFALVWLLTLPLGFSFAGYLYGRKSPTRRGELNFLAIWAIAAILALGLFPSLYLHYALPLAAPLAILSAPYFAQPRIGALGFTILLGFNLATADVFDIGSRLRARPAEAALVAHIRRVTPDRSVLVFGMPSYLYAELGIAPPTILAFPAHMYEGAEAGSSGIDEVAELQRVLRNHPATIVVQEPLPAWPLNMANTAQIAAYIRQCRAVARMPLYDHQGQKRMAIYSRCRSPEGS